VSRQTSILGDAIRGGVAGAAGTWVMDQVTTAMLQAQDPEVTAREEAARPNDKSAVDNLIDRVTETLGVELSDDQRGTAAQVVHFGLGVLPGALFAVLRRRVPLVGWGGGLLYGALLWAVNDEWANTQLGLAAPPEAYPSETHLRGLVGHLVLGSMTNSGIDALGG
jgi:hypothetical protein